SFFFSSRRRHTIFSRDWSSDVCSSDPVSCIRSSEISSTAGEMNLKNTLTAKLAMVTNNTEKAVWRLENNAHTAGPYKGTPVSAPDRKSVVEGTRVELEDRARPTTKKPG